MNLCPIKGSCPLHGDSCPGSKPIEPKLLPCPFCGRAPRVYVDGYVEIKHNCNRYLSISVYAMSRSTLISRWNARTGRR